LAARSTPTPCGRFDRIERQTGANACLRRVARRPVNCALNRYDNVSIMVRSEPAPKGKNGIVSEQPPGDNASTAGMMRR
jgi:hypothetical protein